MKKALLRCEQLEDRLVLDTFTWTGLSKLFQSWSDPKNWKDNAVQAKCGDGQAAEKAP
jgi:hypothetical protein